MARRPSSIKRRSIGRKKIITQRGSQQVLRRASATSPRSLVRRRDVTRSVIIRGKETVPQLTTRKQISRRIGRKLPPKIVKQTKTKPRGTKRQTAPGTTTFAKRSVGRGPKRVGRPIRAERPEKQPQPPRPERTTFVARFDPVGEGIRFAATQALAFKPIEITFSRPKRPFELRDRSQIISEFLPPGPIFSLARRGKDIFEGGIF